MSSSSRRRGPERADTAREAAMLMLTRVEQEKAYSNLLLNRTLQRSTLTKADAGLATELVYGTIQRLNTIDYFLNGFVKRGVGKLDPWVRSLLRLSFYQLRYLDRVPDHAVVHEAVEIAKRRGHAGIAGMVNGVLRSVLRERDRGRLEIPALDDPAGRIALAQSHPEWLVREWLAAYGEAVTEAICEADNRPPNASVRVNRLRATPEELAERMREAGLAVRPSAIAPQGLVVEHGGNLAHTEWYERGELTVQDESSMLVAELLAPAPGMRVLDACAAPGGKTGHIGELMADRGELVASDIHEHKRKLVEEQAARLGLSCVRAIAADAKELGGRYPAGSFDRILLDAPCSGLGIIRRKPDIKWAKSAKEIAGLPAVQRGLLEALLPLLAPGGRLVYSTCTLRPEENERLIAGFAADHPELAPAPLDEPFRRLREDGGIPLPEGAVLILPHLYESDGFFMCALDRRS